MRSLTDENRILGRLKPLVNDPTLWPAFVEYIHYMLNFRQNTLSSAKDVYDMCRHQGEVRELKTFLNLRDKVNGPDPNA